MKLEFLLLFIIQLSENNLKGRTVLQKIVYFYSILLKKDFGYLAHYYGPYSALVENTLNNLKSLGYVKEDVSTWGIDWRGFEKKKYSYSLSKDGEELLEYLSKDSNVKKSDIEQIYFSLKENINLDDSSALSVAAKTFHIISKKSSSAYNIEAIRDEAKNLGWEVEEKQINDATNFLIGLNLIQS